MFLVSYFITLILFTTIIVIIIIIFITVIVIIINVNVIVIAIVIIIVIILDNERHPSECKRVDAIEESKDFFVRETVPATIERQSGEVSRQLKKAYEAFDISKQKEFNREKKFVFKANSHMQYTAQRFEDENKIMTATFFNLEDDIVENERRSARIALHQWDKAMTSVKELRDVNDEEKTIREVEDTDLLDTVIETQQLLQETILEHFGTMNEGNGKDFSKLNKRMNKIKDKKVNGENEIITNAVDQ